MKSLMHLAPGDHIVTKLIVGPDKVKNWQYANECPRHFGPIGAHVTLEVFEVCKIPAQMWVKAYIPHSHDTMYLKISGAELAANFTLPADQDEPRYPPTALMFGEKARVLLKSIETLRLKPYDDQTGQEVKGWTVGATIGYGHLIRRHEWEIYKNGISKPEADGLFLRDLAPFVSAVQAAIRVPLWQHQFDALVLFAYNVGIDPFKGSSVVSMINHPTAPAPYGDLQAAWMAWSRSQGQVMAGLVQRRKCEWDIYSKGLYRRW